MSWLDSLFGMAIEFAVLTGYDDSEEDEENKENKDNDDKDD